MAAADPQRPQAPFRFSRYRSLRKPILPTDNTSEEPPLPPMPPPPDQTSTATATLSRTMSRYHRQRPPAAQTAPPPPLPPAVARAPTQRSQPLPSARSRSANLPAGPQAAPSRDNQENDRQYAEAAREEAMRMLEGAPSPATLKAEKRAKLEEAERLKAKQIADEHDRRKAERTRKYNEKQAEDLRAQELRARQDAIRAEALRAQQEEESRQDEMEREPRPTPRNPLARHSHSPPSPGPDSSQKRERLGLLRKRRDESPPQPVEPPSAPTSRQVSNERGDPTSTTIKPGGGGVVPGTDAPVSAVNSGDRRVMVECNSQRILLPVTPETTCLDLIRSAANVLSEPINPQASVMLEFFTKCGVQRPLRKYERVRDVLNSWDDDRQNNLVLIESPTGGRDHDLSVASVPEAKPTGYSCFMYYSQKPGKWSKRWITMQTNGQITSAKNDSGKDTTVVCHMSDFDIYTPTPTQQRNIKPPKRYCFAVKSQQRSNMFESTASYVHFFSTSHKDPAADFFSSVQGWRSWYLVRVMGEGQKKPKAGDQLAHNLTSTRKVSGTHGQNQESSKALARPNTSDSSHYQIGSFKPFFDPSSFEPSSTPELNLQPKVPSPPDRIMSMRNRSHPPVSYQNSSRLNSLSANNTSSDEEPFSSGGLLGRTYSQRQRVAAQRDAAARNAGPFADGPSLLNNLSSSVPSRSSIDEAARPQRMGSVRSTRGSAQIDAPRRTNTTRMPKPLVDLTPQYQAPPQFQKKGKGYNPGSVGSGCLIDSATSPEVAIQIPPSKDWRARAGGSGARPATSGVDRSKSIRAPVTKHSGAMGAVNNHSLVPQSDADAFTGSGLIAKASWGPTNKGAPLGRGVIDGSKAKGPLLDVSESSRFAPGSLLAGVAAQHPSAPVISRE